MDRRSLSISGIAHDLNNQIMILFHSLDRLMRDHPEDEDLNLSLKAIEQCAQLTAQLLPSPSNKKRDIDSVSVRRLIGDTALLVRALLPAWNRLELECNVDRLIPGVLADLQQVLVNLCLNALQAMDGPGVIQLTAEYGMECVCISVCDTGPGVPAQLRERVFDPLFTTRAEHGGHGLGLARVRETVDRMGGTVEVSDAVPHGACFSIRLPLIAPSVTLEIAHLSD